MKEAKKNPVNRCFGNCPNNPKKYGKPKFLPPPVQKREEEVKRILLATAERKKANRTIGSLLSQFKGRYSLLQLLPLIKRLYPYALAVAIERVEGQRSRHELSMEKVVELEKFKASLKQEK